MSNGPMVSAALLLRVKRERDLLWWLVLALLKSQAPAPKPAPRPRSFDWRKLQANDR